MYPASRGFNSRIQPVKQIMVKHMAEGPNLPPSEAYSIHPKENSCSLKRYWQESEKYITHHIQQILLGFCVYVYLI